MKETQLAVGAMALLFGGAAFSQIKLQTWDKASTLKLRDSSGRFSRKLPIYARRGSILARDGAPLARDVETYEIRLDFRTVPKSEAFFVELSSIIGVPATELRSLALLASKTPSSWSKNLTPTQTKEFGELKGSWRVDGMSLVRSQKRSYPLGADASCLVGWIRDLKPELGIEKAFAKDLTGVAGEIDGPVDRRGEFLASRPTIETPKKDGQDVTLTIDRDLQTIAASAVRSAVQKNRAEYGVALVYDPKSGDILAMANWPSFTPATQDSSAADMTLNSGFNPNIMAGLEPGSIFKVLTVAKSLDLGRITMRSSINCTGEMHPSGNTLVHCDSHHGNRAHGIVDPESAIARSCNVSAATWALGIEREPMFEYIKALGLRDKPSLGLLGETSGYLREDEPAKRLQLAHLGFGQSINCTPMALVSAIGMIANGGVRVKPRLVKRVGFRETAVDPGTRIIKKSTAEDVLRCMEAVVESERGSGKTLKIPGYRLAGKTGTAEIVGRGAKGYCSNFVGFVPAKDPQAVVLVMVNRPQGNYYGADVAGPAFKEIARGVIHKLNIQPTIQAQTVAPVLSQAIKVAAAAKASKVTPSITDDLGSDEPLKKKSSAVSKPMNPNNSEEDPAFLPEKPIKRVAASEVRSTRKVKVADNTLKKLANKTKHSAIAQLDGVTEVRRSSRKTGGLIAPLPETQPKVRISPKKPRKPKVVDE